MDWLAAGLLILYLAWCVGSFVQDHIIRDYW
jgi:hypothetical protein